jgi:hypothetical protein
MHNDKMPVQGASDERRSDRVCKIRRNATALATTSKEAAHFQRKLLKEVTQLQNIISTVTACPAENDLKLGLMVVEFSLRWPPTKVSAHEG